MKRPIGSSRRGATACRIAARHLLPRGVQRMHTAVTLACPPPPPPLVSSSHHHHDHHSPLESAVRNDFDSFLRAELGDGLFFPGPGRTDALVTDRKTVVAVPGRCLLSPGNSPAWAPIMDSLRARGALTPSDRAAAQVFLAAATYQDIFPWLWDGALPAGSSQEATLERPTTAAAAIPPPATAVSAAAATAAAVSVDPETAIKDLRSVTPEQWAALVTAATATATATTGDGLLVLQRWQNVLFAVAANPAFATSTELLRAAHGAFLCIVDRYYAACVAAQAAVPLPRKAPTPALGRFAAASDPAASRFSVTRMPPMLLRRMKRHYRAHFALLDYAVLVERVVCGEEAVVAAMEGQVAAALTGAAREVPDAFPRHLSTAVLDEDELFLFYITIPGRREAGLEWEPQWEHTLRHGAFAFARLFRTRLLTAPVAQLQAHYSEAAAAAAAAEAAGLEVVRSAAGMLMNVCVWVRNNNAEGDRFLSATRLILATYLDTADRTLPAGQAVDAAQAWRLVRVLREAGFAAMVAKAERLQFACSPGLLAVATAATALEILRPDGDSVITLRDIGILLSESKPGTAAVWAAATGHTSARAASRYGLVAVGLRLMRAVVAAASAPVRTLPRSATGRVGQELREWCREVGRPLRLAAAEMEALWHGQLPDSDDLGGSASRAAWSALFAGATAASRASWLCGCGFAASSRGAVGAAAACPACVLRVQVPHSWQCPQCEYTAGTGEPTAFCLHCGAGHPALGSANNSNSYSRSLPVLPIPAHPSDPALAESLAASSLFICDDCHQCSASDASAPPLACGACGGSRGYTRGVFAWDCGCGAANAATHSHCWACTRRRAEVVADDEVETRDRKLPESAPAIAETAPEGFAPAYRCVFCQHDVPVSGGEDAGGTTAAALAGPGLYAECPHCCYPHPRHLASVEVGRLVNCPGCAALLPADGEGIGDGERAGECHRCHAAGVPAVARRGPLLLSAQADQPWRCHGCGHSIPIHGGDCDGCAGESCAVCGTGRVPPAVWELGRRWGCGCCCEAANFGFQCRRCHALPAHLPAAEVRVWRCPTCVSSLNYSWQAECSLPGCGGRQLEAVAAHRGQEGEEGDGGEAVVWLMPFAPWECAECGAVNPTDSVTACCGCGATATATVAVAAVVDAQPAADEEEPSFVTPFTRFNAASDDDGDDDEDRRAMAAEKAAFEQSLARHRRPLLDFTAAAADTVADATAEDAVTARRLSAVEALLLSAADGSAPTVASAGTGRSGHDDGQGIAAAAPAHPLTAPCGAAVGEPSREAWEDAYDHAVLSV